MRILPDGYTQLEYIEGTGTQHINTNIAAKSTLKIQAKFNMSAVTGYVIIGHYTSEESTLRLFNASGKCYLDFGNGTTGRITGGTMAAGIEHEIEFGNRYVKNIKTGANIVSGNTVPSFEHSANIHIFGNTNFSAGKIYYCKIYEKDVLVRNFVPCKNPSGEIGLYDLANDVFYGNAGTGTFIAGPEFSYNEVEYIESTGTQYIDTGFCPNNNTRVVVDAKYKVANINASLFGTFENTNGTGMFNFMQLANGSFRSDYNSSLTQTWSVDTTERRIIDKNKETTTVDNVSQSYTNSAFQTTRPLVLFALNYGGTIGYQSSAVVYSCQIYDNGTLIRDYIPVIGTNGVAGLWDKVEKVFYGNAGTGAFIAGNEVLTEWTDLEYIESTGTQYVDTGFKPNQDTRVVCKGICDAENGTRWLFGVRYSSSSKAFGFTASTNGYYVAFYNSGSKSFDKSFNSKEVIEIDCNKAIATLKANGKAGSVTGASGAFASDYNLVLFAGNTKDTITCSSVTIYSCQIYDNDVLVRDYIPCITSDGRIGLRNALNNTFFPNMGSGVFVAGPIIPDVLPPAAPEKANVAYTDFANVLLTWSISETAESYNIMRNGELIDTTGNTFFFDNKLNKETAYSYSISALNEGGESEPVTVLAETTKFKLITDRTASDVQEAIQAINTGTLPDAWFAGLKGAYNAVDFNRVEAAVLFVIERLKTAGWYLTVQSKTNWNFADFPSAAEMQRYIDNIRLLRSALPTNMPVVPDTMRLFRYDQANAIEQMLEMLDAAVTNIMLNVYYTNEVYSGEV